MASAFQTAVAQALADQPWYIRRKDTITTVATAALQVLNLAGGYLVGAPVWLTIMIAVLVFVAQILVIAGTKGSITPSMLNRIDEAGQKVSNRILDPDDDLEDLYGKHRVQ